MGSRDVHTVGIRVLPAQLLLDLHDLWVHGHLLPSLLSLLLVAVEGIAPKHHFCLLHHLVFYERQEEEKSREQLVSPLSQVGKRPFLHFQPKFALFLLTLALCSKTKRIQQRLFLRKLILKPVFVLRGTGPPFESIFGKRQLRDRHDTNQMFKRSRLAALSAPQPLSVRALLSTNKFRNLRSKPKLEAKPHLALPIDPQPTTSFFSVAADRALARRQQ